MFNVIYKRCLGNNKAFFVTVWCYAQNVEILCANWLGVKNDENYFLNLLKEGEILFFFSCSR